MSPAWAAPLTLLAGCAVEEWRGADLQLDVTGAQLGPDADEVLLRICVEGVGNEEEALGAGSVAFAGLPAGDPLTITADTLSEDDAERRTGRVGPVTLGADTPYSAEPWLACEGDDCAACQANGDLAAPGAVDWLLAVRLLNG